jgi:hypothetical protein
MAQSPKITETKRAMNNVFPLRPGEQKEGSDSGDGGGPEDPMVEQRIQRLEAGVSEIKSTLLKLDAKFDLLDAKFDGKLGEMDSRLSGKLGEMDGRLSGKIGEMDGRLTGKLGAIEGRLSGIEGRFNQVPTIWGMLGIVATLLIGIAGLMFTAGKFFHP